MLKGSYGLIWTRARAKLCKRSYHMGSNAPAEQSNLCLLCRAAADGVSHVLSGCVCPAIKACHIARHNAAGLQILRALARGPRGGCFWLSDVTSAENTPEFSSGTRLPRWMMPDVAELTPHRLRPDALRIGTLLCTEDTPGTRADRSKHTVDIIEVGYCSDTRMSAKIAEKEEQHEQLRRLSLEAGWKEATLLFSLWIHSAQATCRPCSTWKPSASCGLRPRSCSPSCPAMRCILRRGLSAGRLEGSWSRSSGATLGGMSGSRALASVRVGGLWAFCGDCILTVVGLKLVTPSTGPASFSTRWDYSRVSISISIARKNGMCMVANRAAT